MYSPKFFFFFSWVDPCQFIFHCLWLLERFTFIFLSEDATGYEGKSLKSDRKFPPIQLSPEHLSLWNDFPSPFVLVTTVTFCISHYFLSQWLWLRGHIKRENISCGDQTAKQHDGGSNAYPLYQKTKQKWLYIHFHPLLLRDLPACWHSPCWIEVAIAQS